MERTGWESAYPPTAGTVFRSFKPYKGCKPQLTGLQAQSISFTQTYIHSFNIHLVQGTVLNDEDTPANETDKKLYSQSIYLASLFSSSQTLHLQPKSPLPSPNWENIVRKE